MSLSRSITGMRLARPAPLALLAAFALSPAPAHAHELGLLGVTIRLEAAGECVIEAVVDAEHLPPGLKPFPESEFIAGAALVADGAKIEAPFRSERRLAAAGAPEIVFRAAGRVPAGARWLRWSQPLELGQYLLTVHRAGEAEPERLWVEGGAMSAPVGLADAAAAAPPRSAWHTVLLYLELGFTHIVPKGLDHILFVLSLFLMSLTPRALVMQVTAFTAAHSITLALAMLGLASLSASIVEPMIALSITWVAVENVITRTCRPSRTAVVFLFGLLHGLGFAGVLTELGLPEEQFAPALIAFNAGVEAGQLAVVAAACLALARPWGKKPWYRARVVVPASLAIALVGAYWTIERIAG